MRHMIKAKRLDNKEWIEGYLIEDGVTGKSYIHARGNSVNESDRVGEEGCLQFVAYEIDPDTACKTSNLPDEAGKVGGKSKYLRQELGYWASETTVTGSVIDNPEIVKKI